MDSRAGRVVGATVIVVAVALLVPGAAAAQGGLPEPAVPEIREPCKPKSGRLCAGSASGSARKAARAVSRLGSSAKTRRGLGLPRARPALGRRAKKKLAAADRKLARRLAAPLANAAASARIRRGASASSTATNGRSALRRRARLEVEVEVCPTTASAASSHGRIAVLGRARYEIESISRQGRRHVMELIALELDISRDGLVDSRARYAGFPPDPDRIRAIRSRAVFDPRTRRSSNSRSTRFDFEATSLDPENITVDFDPSGFERWIERTVALDRGDPGPDPPEQLAGRAWLQLVREFTRWTGARLREVVLEAERNWRTPNKCVRLTLNGPAELAPGAKANVTGRLTHVGGAGVDEGLYGPWVHFTAAYVNGGSAIPLATLPLDTAEPWYEYTAPAAPWADSARPGLDVTATTKGGIGRAPITFELISVPAAFNGTFSGTGDYDANELGEGNHLRATWSGSFHVRKVDVPGAAPTVGQYAFQHGSMQYRYLGRVGDCDVTGNGRIDLGRQPDFQGAHLLYVEEGDPRKYQLTIGAPLVAQVPGIKAECEDPNDNGDRFDWSPAAGVPWMAYAPLPGGPVGADWSITGGGQGNSGPGTPDQTWRWGLTPVP
jgi:hypothetical protein